MRTALIVLVVALSASCCVAKFTDWIKTSFDTPAVVSENVDIVFTPDRETVVFIPLKNFPFLMNHHRFNASQPTMMYIHGWMESGKLDLSASAIRNAYLYRQDHNVLTVDWSHYSKNVGYQINVIPQMKIIAETIAEFLRDFFNLGYDINKFHLVGHSLGGQMVGKIGRQLKKITSNRMKIQRIIALDPAGPYFEDHSLDGFEPIARTDGEFVQIIHTCSGALGMARRVGHIDFYPNGGFTHPGCNVDAAASVFENLANICNHARSWQLYQATVRDPEGFLAVRCDSWDDFATNTTCFYDDIVKMGFGTDSKERGKYFLRTGGNMFDMAKGLQGTRPREINITVLSSPIENLDLSDIPMAVQSQVIF